MSRRPPGRTDHTTPPALPRGVERAVVAASVSAAVEDETSGLGLPTHLAALVNPEVLARRHSLVTARLQDAGAERVRLRRCADIVALHLLKTHAHA